jgi:hypothetical protein
MSQNPPFTQVFLGVAILVTALVAAEQIVHRTDGGEPWSDPPHVPPLFGPHGKLDFEGMTFSTDAYERRAIELVLREANLVAEQLRLPEKMPITGADLTRIFVVPYGMSRLDPGMIGNVNTRNYGYFVSVDHKLSFVQSSREDADCIKWREEYTWPISRVDTNAAYGMATQWLAAAMMDVEALNRDCVVEIRPNPYWNAGMRRGMFVPIYDVHWKSERNIAERYGDVAYVKLFAPTRTLVSLNVRESRYILREPLVFTNLNELLATPRK